MKHTVILFVALAVVFALSSSPASSYVRSTTASNNGLGIAWNLTNPSPTNVTNGKITYTINSAGSDNVPFAQVEQAINASFKAWEDIPTCAITFTEGPVSSTHSSGSDNIFPIYWVESSGDPDYSSISSALAVTFTFRFTSGPRVGEITDANMVFNGVDNTWATDGSTGAFDIAEVATHEIGHAIGLNHSPIGTATMFPRTGTGVTKSRTLSTDDQIAASLIYPVAGFLATTGTIQGRVADGSNNNIFGANVVATDANGNVAACSLSQSDGTYSIQGLNPGSYTVFAAPLDPSGGLYFSNSNIGGASGFYGTINTDFQPSADQSATVTANASTTVNLSVVGTTPTMRVKLIRNPADNTYSNSGKTVTQGQSNLLIGLSGTGLPASGTPLTVSGTGITVLGTSFSTLQPPNADPAIRLTINVAANAAPGGRNLIVTLPGGERAIAPGALEVVRSGTTTTVSAASFLSNSTVASESIVSLFGGGGLTNSGTPVLAASIPLPTSLGGTNITVNGVQAPLLFVFGTQINFEIPPNTASGLATVVVNNTTAGTSFTETLAVSTVAPGLFTASATGQGPLSGIVQRRPASGPDVFEQVAHFNGTTFVTDPINLDNPTDLVALQLFGTGIRFNSGLSNVSATIGGVSVPVLFAGAQGSFVGLDQVNLQLTQSLRGKGEVDLVLTVDGKTANTVKVNIK